MNLSFTSEQEEFQRQLRKFVTSNWSIQEIGHNSERWSSISGEAWNTIGDDLYLLGLSISESNGGAGYGYVETGIAFYEMGRALVGGEFISTTALALPALQALAGNSDSDSIVGKILSGQLKATVALPSFSRNDIVNSMIAVSRMGSRHFSLTGVASEVLNAGTADVILVYADYQDSLCLFELSSDDGIKKSSLNCVDETRSTSSICLEGVAARMIGQVGDGSVALKESLHVARCLLAMELVGAAEACMELSVEYANTREQFGSPIGKFQVIKHKCAEMLLALEPARAAAYYGTLAASEKTEEILAVSNIVKLEAANALYTIASHAVQIHGGLGITWDHPVSWYFRRSVWAREFLGGEPLCGKNIDEVIGF